jgi:hypothetical protein
VHSQDNSIASWTWSKNLSTQFIYRWNVSEFKVDGQDILVADESDFPIRLGSIISVELNQELHGLDYLELANISVLEYLFSIYVDGTKVENVGNLGIEFIYPNTIQWMNGTESNLYDFDADEYSHQFRFPETGERDNDSYIFTVNDQYSSLLIARDVPTGLLLTWYQVFREGSIRYDFLGYLDPSPPSFSVTSNAEFALDKQSILGIAVFLSMFLVVLYKRKNWISNTIK